MANVLGNYPLEEIFTFRESGYSEELVRILCEWLPKEFDIYVYFKLSKWQGDDLKINNNNNKKLVICIGDESRDVDYSFAEEVDYIFRTYLPDYLHNKFHHLAVGPSAQFVGENIIDFSERKYNVFFSGNLHLGRANLYRSLTGAWPLPFFVLHRVKNLFGVNFDKAFPNSFIRFGTGFHNGVQPNEYATLMQNSKICLCPGGVENPETMRHFEAARLGCIVVTEQLPNVPVYKDAPFVVLSSWRELRKKVNTLLAEPARMLDLHHQTLEWWATRASVEATAASIRTIVGE